MADIYSSSSDSDRDDALEDDIEALRRACLLTGASTPPLIGDHSDGDDDEDDDDDYDVGLIQRLQDRFAPSDSLPFIEPLCTKPPLNPQSGEDDDDEDDFETLRAIRGRFAQYQSDFLKNKNEETQQEHQKIIPHGIPPVETPDFCQSNGQSTELTENQAFIYEESHDNHEETCSPNVKDLVPSKFPKSAQNFVAALKKNRALQKFIRRKMLEVESMIERNKELSRRVKCLVDFELGCKKRIGRILSQNKDLRIKLISTQKPRNGNSKKKTKMFPALCYGPYENSRVSNYRLTLERFPCSLTKKPWSSEEKEKLAKGIKQQYQEMLILHSVNAESAGEDIANSDMMLTNFVECTPEVIRSFLISVNWDRLATMYLPGRSGSECEARWLNCEDTMINQSYWNAEEDKKLLFVVQEMGVYNWIDISIALGTHRTAFQCLSRYQRSLNPYIINKDWTSDEDAKLRAAVECYGNDWQNVSSCLEGRTGAQCLNRWSHSLNPARKKVGRWSIDEDKRLKVAVMLFGAKNWHRIAQFAPGRTQVQCRERWLNCLNPSLNLKPWTAEEDEKLLAAISKHGHCWSKVASCVHPRTDNQCRRRWKVLLPGEVPLQQAARKMKKTIFVSNFVNRASERPAIGPDEFMPLVNDGDALSDKHSRKPKIKSTRATKGKRTEKRIDDSANMVPADLVTAPSSTPTSTQNEGATVSRKRKARKISKGTSRKQQSEDISQEIVPACLNQHDHASEPWNGKKTTKEKLSRTVSKSSQIGSRSSYIRSEDNVPDSSVKDIRACSYTTGTMAINNSKKLSASKMKGYIAKRKQYKKANQSEESNVAAADASICEVDDSMNLASFCKKIKRKHTRVNKRTGHTAEP